MKTPSYRAIAEYYDFENADKPMLREDVPFFLGHLPSAKRRRQSVLEIAVGTGRAAIPIAQAGHRVIGVDYDAEILELASRKRDAVGLKVRDLQLLRGDARKLNLQKRFDWVCIFFNTFLAFPTLSEQDRVLQVVRRHLKPNGHAWLDMFQPDIARLATQKTKNADVTPFYVPSLDRTVVVSTDLVRDHVRQMQEVTFRYQWFDELGRVHHQRRQFGMTWIFPRELRLLLERNGLELVRLYGNYDGSMLAENSPRMITLARAMPARK